MLNIRTTGLALLATISFLTATAATGKDGWITVRPSDRSFSVQMPGFPDAETSVFHDRQAGTVSVYVYYLTNDGNVFRIAESRYPAGRFRQSDALDTLAKEAEITGKILKATLATSNEKVVDGHKVRTMTYTQGQSEYKTMTVFAGDRKFTIYAGAQNPSVGGHDVDRFLNSFQVTAR